MFDRPVDVLIIGAGPYGLSLGSRLRHLGIDYRIVGVPMSFWRQHMPKDVSAVIVGLASRPPGRS